MIISGGALPSGSEQTADLAVVGAGPAGIVLSLELARAGWDVLLVESGQDTFDADAQALSEAENWDREVHAPMSAAVRRQLGGTSVVWGGRCVPYDPVDFDNRPWIADTTWPVSYSELNPYFQSACDWLQCGRAVFDAAQTRHLPPSVVPGLVSGDGHSSSLERWSLAANFGREYKDALNRSGHVRVITGLTCTEVVTRADDDSLGHLSCRTLDGRRVTIRARCYVLACGGLETTRLLLASHRANGTALGDHSGHLGAWYMGHIDALIADVRFHTPARSTVHGFERDIDGTYVRRRLTVARTAQLRDGLPNAVAFLANPDMADARHRNSVLSLGYLALRSPLHSLLAPDAHRSGATVGKLRNSAAGVATPPLRHHLANIARDPAPVIRYAGAFAASRLQARGRMRPSFFTAYSADNVYPLQYHGEQVPSRLSRVSLSGKRDSVGMPKLAIDLRFSQQDIDSVLQYHKIWDDYLKLNGCGQLEYRSQDPASAAWSRLGGGTHQLGTTRMAGRAEDGVVDRQLAVHGTANLYVASSSAFLTSSQANPTFMIVVFALRLADHLRSRLGAL